MELYLVSSIRTNNFNDEKVVEKIKVMWTETSQKLSGYQKAVYGVYYDYESNYKGDYTLSAATCGKNGESFIEIPESEKYKVFKVDTTDDQGIMKTWSTIWQQEEMGVLLRAYTYDYEKYYPNGEVEVYIAVK